MKNIHDESLSASPPSIDREARSPYGSPSGDPQGPPAVIAQRSAVQRAWEAVRHLAMSDVGDLLHCLMPGHHHLDSLTTAERRALGGHRFRDGDHVARLVSHALIERPALFARVPFTGHSLLQRTARLTELHSLERALLSLARLVSDTRLREEAERNQLLLAVVKHADQQSQDPFCDPQDALLRNGLLSEAKRILALHYHGNRKVKSPGRRAAMAGKPTPWREARRKLLGILTHDDVRNEPEGAKPEPQE